MLPFAATWGSFGGAGSDDPCCTATLYPRCSVSARSCSRGEEGEGGHRKKKNREKELLAVWTQSQTEDQKTRDVAMVAVLVGLLRLVEPIAALGSSSFQYSVPAGWSDRAWVSPSAQGEVGHLNNPVMVGR